MVCFRAVIEAACKNISPTNVDVATQDFRPTKIFQTAHMMILRKVLLKLHVESIVIKLTTFFFFRKMPTRRDFVCCYKYGEVAMYVLSTMQVR